LNPFPQVLLPSSSYHPLDSTTPNTPISTKSYIQILEECNSQLSRSSRELRVASLFCKEYLMTLALPSTFKFILWLTLQSDEYFRGGRAPSERLSAARIGERVRTSIFIPWTCIIY
jgi:hypothetical protein